jgi:mono/diheme cytochrome c family protein
MPRWPGLTAALGVGALVMATALAETPAQRGQYLIAAAGCITCHTEEREGAAPLAGGRALATPFGTFYSPNITADADTGIGRWSEEQFVSALHDGIGPDGRAYFPAFPYTAYTGMTRNDASAIRAYIFSLPPARHANRDHDLPWYLRSRLAARAWQWLYFRPARFLPDPQRDAPWNRGAYLVRHLGHCGECHSPRDALGAVLTDGELAGNPQGPDDKAVPNITPDERTGIGAWSRSEIETYLEIGMLPDGDFAGAGMGEVIDDNTSQLSAADRTAIATYLQALPARTSRSKRARIN